MHPGIMVFGATGRTGRLVVERLRARGVRPKALVRGREAAAALLGEGVALIEGDLRDPAALARAAAESDRFLFVAGGFRGRDAGAPREVDYAAVAALAALLRGRPAAHVVLLSSAGVTQSEHPHNCAFDGVLRWKLRGEEALRASGTGYAIVRALGLRDRTEGAQGVRLVQGDRIAFGEDIARGDVATLLADMVAPADGSLEAMVGPLAGRTFEVFNDAELAGGRYAAARPLRPDPA